MKQEKNTVLSKYYELSFKQILVTLILLCLLSNQSFAQSTGYFDQIATASGGRLTRFTNLPIKIYPGSLEIQNLRFRDDLIFAIKEWEECSSGLVKFEMVASPDTADILISWLNKLDNDYREHPLGIAELQRITDDDFHVELQIGLRDPITLQPLTSSQMRIVLLHELGHAIGLWGHSKEKSDIMYYATSAGKYTDRDAETIRMVYSCENGYSLHEQSIASIKEDMGLNPDDANLYFLLGTVYMDREDQDIAIENFKKCLDIDPGLYKARIALASAYNAIGKKESALAEYMHIVKTKPSPMIYNLIGISYFDSSDYIQSIDHFKKALEINHAYQPSRMNLYKVYLNKGREMINDRRHDDAIQLMKDAIIYFPDSPEIYCLLGTAYAGKSQFRDALSQYKEALRINPVFAPAKNYMASCYNNMGVEYTRSGMWEDAIRAYSEALNLMPDMDTFKNNLSAVYWNWADDLSKAGKDREAIGIYQQYLRFGPESRDAYNNLGALYFRLGDFSEAASNFEMALKLDPDADADDIRENLAITYQRWGIDLLEKGLNEQSISQFNKSLYISKSKVNIYLDIALAYQGLKKWEDAYQQINKAMKLEPDNMDAKKILASLEIEWGNRLIKTKDYDSALKHYLRIPNDLVPISVHNNITCIYIINGMYIAAADEIDKVLKADPENELAAKNLNLIEKKLMKRKKAESELARIQLSKALMYIVRGDLKNAKKSLKLASDLPKDKSLSDLFTQRCNELSASLSRRGAKSEAKEIIGWTTLNVTKPG